MNTTHKKVQLLGFQGHAATHKALITIPNVLLCYGGAYPIDNELYSSWNTFSEVVNFLPLRSTSYYLDGLGLASVLRMPLDRKHCAHS